MKNVLLAAVALIATVVTASTSQAAFVKVAGGNVALVNNGNKVHFGVHQNTGASAASFLGQSVAAGSYIYLYQIAAPLTAESELTVNAMSADVGAFGLIDGVGLTNAGDIGTNQATATGTEFNSGDFYGATFDAPAFSTTRSSILFLTSTLKPVLGSGSVVSDSGSDSFSLPVAVPLPGAVALFAMGIPALFFGRKLLQK